MIADRFMDFLASGYKETPEPSMDGVQVAAGPTEKYPQVMTDSGPATYIELRGMAQPDKAPTAQRFHPRTGRPITGPTMSDVTEPAMGLLNMGAATAKGAVQGFAGLPGDIEALGYGVKELLNRGADESMSSAFMRGLQDKTIAPTTEEVKKWLDTNVGTVGDGKNPYETVGEVLAPGGHYKAGKALVKGLAPTAGEMVIKSMEKLGTPVQMNIVPPGPNTVSTRLPTAVKATEDPLANNLSIDFQAIKSDPEAFKYNMGLVQQYPNFASKARNPEKRAEDFIDEVKNNLLYLYDKVPEQTRERSKLWYDGARNITNKWSEQYQIPDQAVSGVLAVLSPQKDWFMNVSLGQRVLDIMGTKQTTKWDNTMSEMAKVIWSKPQYAPMVDAIKGKALDEITDPGLKAMWLRTYDQAYNPREHQIVTPEGDFAGLRMNADGKTPTKTGWGSLNEIGKAIVILEDPSKANISNNLGAMHKVRNFYNNIYAPNDPSGAVTIDTHAVAAGLLRPLSGNSREVLHNFGSGITGEGGPKNSSITGVQGTYGLYAEAYRRAAQERSVLPREMQSITWEAVRGLFPDTFKSQAKNVDQVDGIWLKYRKGQLSLDEARNEVFNAAGGINPPEWEGAGLRAGTTPEVQAPTNQGELPGTSVPRGTTQGLGSGKRNGTTRTVPQSNSINKDQSSSGGIE
jgi:hypothetical protein